MHVNGIERFGSKKNTRLIKQCVLVDIQTAKNQFVHQIRMN